MLSVRFQRRTIIHFILVHEDTNQGVTKKRRCNATSLQKKTR